MSARKLPRAVLNQAHARRLIANPDTLMPRGKRDRALLQLLYGTAIRVGECERLDVKDLDLARGQLMLRSGNKDRVVPVVGRAAIALEAYLRDARPELVKDPRDGVLFITSWGTRLNTKRIQDLIGAAMLAAIESAPHRLSARLRLPSALLAAELGDNVAAAGREDDAGRKRMQPFGPGSRLSGGLSTKEAPLRRFVTLFSTPLLALAALAGPSAAGEATRTLRLQLSGDPSQPFAVENLAGTMKIAPGTGDAVVAVATVHAESDELASSMRFEQVTGEKGVPTLRLRYPVDRYSTFRYGRSAKREGFLDWIFGGSSQVKYDGARVTVSGTTGVLLYADVEVQVPKKAIDAVFRNVVGPLSGQGLEGKVKLDTASGDVALRDVRGEIAADTGSGNVKATDIQGSFQCDTGSGDCDVTRFKGERLKCDTGSGQINVASASARLIDVDTGSGDVHVSDADAEEFAADTGSGDIELESRGERLTHVKADTGSGSVKLRLGPAAGFEARASTASGEVVSHYADAQPIVHGKEVVGYRRGDGRIRITVETGSGDVVIEPGR